MAHLKTFFLYTNLHFSPAQAKVFLRLSRPRSENMKGQKAGRTGGPGRHDKRYIKGYSLKQPVHEENM